MERKVRIMMMTMEIDEIRSIMANLQIDYYQITQKFEMLEEKIEILELKLNDILDRIGSK